MTEQEMLEAIPTVVKSIESWDTTTVRASVPNYLISKYIAENTDCKVIFQGDGMDEVAGSYLYLSNAPDGPGKKEKVDASIFKKAEVRDY